MQLLLCCLAPTTAQPIVLAGNLQDFGIGQEAVEDRPAAGTSWIDLSKRVKPVLYAYRVLMTGIHLLDTGELEANLRRLNRHFGLAFLDDLIALKTVERATVDLERKYF